MTASATGAEAPAPGASVAVLDQALWRQLLAAPSAQAFGEAWLGLVCRLVPGANAGALVLGEIALVAGAPAGVPASPGLVSAAELAVKEGRGVAQPRPAGGPPAMRLAYPIQIDERVAGAVAIDAEGATDPREAMRQLQWASAWVRDYLRREETKRDRETLRRSGLALEMLAAAIEEEGFLPACRVTATELATRLECERVTVGFLKRHRSHVVCISHSAQFGKRMRLVRLLAAAMDEAVDQRAVVLYPPADEDAAVVTRQHQTLCEVESSGRALTVPMFVKDRFVGAVTFERSAQAPFDQPTVELTEAVVSILGPALIEKRANDRWLILKAGDSLAAFARRLLGPGHLGYKLTLVALVAAAALLYFPVGAYEIVANGQVEGEVRRLMSAPFDGFIGEAPARAGDLVHQGDLIAALDTRDLTLERLRWTTERQQHRYEYEQALGKRERSDALRFESLIAQADAQIHLADEQLARARIVAPFDGLILSGDLTQSIGASTHRGDVLYEIAPLEGYRVVLRAPESQIDDVKPGAKGRLVIAALPDVMFPFTVERTTPVALVRDGATYFQVDARLDQTSVRLRPGMEGVGRIEAGQRRLSWIWLRSTLHWMRLAVWRWFP